MLGWECELEPQTKVREHFTIMENAPSKALDWLAAPTRTFTFN